MVLAAGDPGPIVVTKIGGVPWWPLGRPRPKCERGHHMVFVAQVLLSDVCSFQEYTKALLSFHYCQKCVEQGNMAWGRDDRDNKGYDVSVFINVPDKEADGAGLVTQPLLKPYEISLRAVGEVPSSCEELGITFAEAPHDYPQGTHEFDEHVYPGLMHVGACKVGGWPSWVQSPEWPTTPGGDRLTFVAQLDSRIWEESAWCCGGYAYLFAEQVEGKGWIGQLVIQVT